MKQSLVLLHQEEKGIILLTLNRPEKRNALNIALMKELCKCFESLAQDHSVRAVILYGEPVFCAGLDLQEAMNPTPSVEEESAQMVSHLLRAVYDCPAITFAAVQGAAMGGGAGLMAGFDYVIAAENTRIGFPEIKRGLVPAQIAPILIRQIEGRFVRELLLLGEVIDPERALFMGLINKVVPEKELLSSAKTVAREMLKGAPGALKRTKKLLDLLNPTRLSDDLMKVMPFHMEARQSAEAREGLRAFLEKRDPNW